MAEYTDDAVNDPQIRRIREMATAAADPSVTEDQARIEVELASGEKVERFVEASLGNLERPMTDRQLEEKFRDQAGVLPASRIEDAIGLCWGIDGLSDVGELIRVLVPE